MTKLTDSFLQLQVLVNGGSDIFQTMNAPEIFQNTQWMTQEKWSTIAPLMGTTASWGAPTAISAGASKVFMLPLIGTWFDFVEPYLQCTKADIVLRFSFRASVSAGSGVLAGSNMQVIFEQDHGTEEDNKALIAMHSKYVMRSFYFNTQWVNGSTTFTANTTTNINLQSVTGKAVFMTFALRAGNSATSEGWSTFTALEPSNSVGGTINLVNSQGLSILGGGVIQSAKLRYVDYVKHANSQFTQNNAVYLIPFSDDARKSFCECTLANGMYYFSGDVCNLQITPCSSFSSGTYYYDILVYTREHH